MYLLVAFHAATYFIGCRSDLVFYFGELEPWTPCCYIFHAATYFIIKFILNSSRFVIYKGFLKLEKNSILFVGHGPKPVVPRSQPSLVFFFPGGPPFLSFFLP
jgi:hypothetical protein